MQNSKSHGSLPAPTVAYAKLARPRLHEALPRQRLFALLDALRERHRIVWIASPPGAGKTTLAASYLAAKRCKELWFQLDQGDADPATMFFYLAEAGRMLAHAPLALSVPEGGANAPHLHRLFFRDFFASLPPGTTVVFDNVQEFGWEHAGQLLEQAFAEVPESVHIVALSREVPPSRLIRMEIEGRMGVLGWSDLKFNADEVNGLIALDDEQQPVDAAWLEQLDGWAAGIVMLRSLQHFHGRGAGPGEGRDALFRYFAVEILERMPRTSQHTLLLLSNVQGISAQDAQALTADPGAERLLQQLYHNRLFVERRGTEEMSYHFHALFREFLQFEARQRIPPTIRAEFIQRAAVILDARGNLEQAAQLYQEAGAHEQLASLLLTRAAFMIGAGRGQAWREWMSWLPPGVVEGLPWLRYWNGLSLIQVAPLLARKTLVRAVPVFFSVGDRNGRLLTIAAIIDTYDLEWAEFSLLPSWIEQLRAGLAELNSVDLEPEVDVKLHSRLSLGLLLIDPASPHLAAAAQRASQLFMHLADHTEQLAVAAILLRYFDSVDDVGTAQWLINTVSQVADDALISPFHRVSWMARVARWLGREGKLEQARELAGTAKAIASSHKLDGVLLQLLEIHHLLGSGAFAQAGELIQSLRGSAARGRVRDNVEFHLLDAHWRAATGDVEEAIASARQGIELSIEAGIPASERVRAEVFLAGCLAVTGTLDEALSVSARACDSAVGGDVQLARESSQFIVALARVAEHDDAGADAALLEALTAHRRRHGSTLFPMIPALASILAARALAVGIELDHVRAIVLRQRLQPPERYMPNWPWPVAVYSLGGFSLSLAGNTVSYSGKAQQRPLLLLKALLAAGDPGKAQQALIAQLWPDADDAKSALNVTVHRLRKLLTLDESVLVGGGKVTLAAQLVWSDAAALMHVCDRIDGLPADAPLPEVNSMAKDLLQLYRGPFCDGEEDSFLLAARERFRSRFLAAAASLGTRLEGLGQWPAARQLYSRSLESEPLAEAIYRGLMRCTHALGDPTAAFSVYRRCRETLSIVLGHQPSAETENLAVSLGLK